MYSMAYIHIHTVFNLLMDTFSCFVHVQRGVIMACSGLGWSGPLVKLEMNARHHVAS